MFERFQKNIILALAVTLMVSQLQLPAFSSPELASPVLISPTKLIQQAHPPLLEGLTVDPNNPFAFDFILSPGDLADKTAQNSQSTRALKESAKRLVKYFLASLTVPEKDLWVNLSPYERDRVVAEGFGKTEMGRDLLAQDYLLKQITANLMHPDNEVGKVFWKRVYEESQKRYGTTQIPVNSFNKVWIVPETASVYEHEHTAFIVKSHLKVMLESDYLATKKNTANSTGLMKDELFGSTIVREIVIPILEQEVNEGKDFAPLRQVYHSLILAIWFKKKMKDSLLGKKYVNQNKVNGIERKETTDIDGIYQEYLKTFKKGVYNFIKEEVDPISRMPITRKYFSGGFGEVETFANKGITYLQNMPPDSAQIANAINVRVVIADSSSVPTSDPAMSVREKEELFKIFYYEVIVPAFVSIAGLSLATVLSTEINNPEYDVKKALVLATAAGVGGLVIAAHNLKRYTKRNPINSSDRAMQADQEEQLALIDLLEIKIPIAAAGLGAAAAFYFLVNNGVDQVSSKAIGISIATAVIGSAVGWYNQGRYDALKKLYHQQNYFVTIEHGTEGIVAIHVNRHTEELRNRATFKQLLKEIISDVYVELTQVGKYSRVDQLIIDFPNEINLKPSFKKRLIKALQGIFGPTGQLSLSTVVVDTSTIELKERVLGQLGRVLKHDKAQVATASNQVPNKNLGGIDLTDQRLKLSVLKDPKSPLMVINNQALRSIEIHGLAIQTLELKPVTNLPQLLGINP